MQLKRFVHTFRALGGENEIQLYAPDSRAAQLLFALATGETARFERKYSRYQEDSIIQRINRTAGGQAIHVDSETRALLNIADRFWAESSGCFDCTSGVLRRTWNFREQRVPRAHEVAALLPLIGWEKVEYTGETVRLMIPGMQLDFGGFGKEYAVDRVAGLLTKAGVQHALVNFAGDLRTLGPKPDGTPWHVGIAHPRRAGGVVTTLELTGGSLATSGDYERSIVSDGRRYSHLLDPGTGWPVESSQSVSVRAESCLEAGFLSSVTLLRGEDTGLLALRQSRHPWFVVRQDGRVCQSAEFGSTTRQMPSEPGRARPEYH